MGLFSSIKESWQFGSERDPDLWDREKADWRAKKAAKARLEAKQARVRAAKGGKK